MSESAVILEGEVARRFNPVDKLRVTNQDSSVSDWVPSDTLDLGSLMASENTLYLANIDDDCDAYEEVEVDVSEELEDGDYKKITGKGNDGNDYAVGLDENGNLTSEMVPSAIHIVIKPRKLEYEEGETLDFTGIHVYLMDGNNQRFTSEDYPTGEIPFEELIFPVTIAESTGEGASSDLETVLSQPIGFYSGLSGSSGVRDDLYSWKLTIMPINQGDDVRYTIVKIVTSDYSRDCVLVTSKEPNSGITIVCDSYKPNGKYNTTSIKNHFADTAYTINGKKVYYNRLDLWNSSVNNFMNDTGLSNCSVDIESSTVSENDAWTLQYGSISRGNNDIPVQWMRSDGEMLVDKFGISVSSNENGGENNTSGEF